METRLEGADLNKKRQAGKQFPQELKLELLRPGTGKEYVSLRC